MTVGIVLVTHGQIGKALIEVAEFVLNEPLEEVCFSSFSEPDARRRDSAWLSGIIDRADSGDGVLVLTDLVGASPANLVRAALKDTGSYMVTGVNLGMLIRIWNYRDRPLKKLAKLAAEGGTRGIEVFEP